MVEKTTTLETLQAELKQCLARYTNDPDAVLAEIWPHIVEAIDFAEFLKQQDNGQGAIMEDPLAHMSEEEREKFIEEKWATLDPKTRQMLDRTRGKWAADAK